jgi:hypothetical protein
MNVADFNDMIQAGVQMAGRMLESEERRYKYDIYRELFDFGPICSGFGVLRKVWRDKLHETYESEHSGILRRLDAADQAQKVAGAFRAQLSHIEAAMMPDDTFLNERLTKASGYFHPIVEDMRTFCSGLLSLEIDNKESLKKHKEILDELLVHLEVKSGSMETIQKGGFTVEGYNKAKTGALLEERTQTRARRLKKVESEAGMPCSVNEELKERLQEWRSERFKKDNVPAYVIMHQMTLMSIATHIPKTRAELLKIKGFGQERFNKYGEEILAITAEF